MRFRVAGIAAALVFGGGILVFAQAGPRPTNQQPNDQRQTGEMVISGCLKSSSSEGGKVTSYTLEGRRPTRDVYPPTLNPAPEDATAPRATPITPANTVYSLSASSPVDFDQHVGQQVELTGRMQPAVREAGAVGTTGTLGAQAQGEFAAPAPRRFEVSAVKLLSTKCE